MLTADDLRDMHARIVEAYAIGTSALTQVSNWTPPKDEPAAGPFPICWWLQPMPRNLIEVRNNNATGNSFTGFLLRAAFLKNVATGRTYVERDNAYSEMVSASWDVFMMFLRTYIVPVSVTLPSGKTVRLELVGEVTYDDVFADHGTGQLVGCGYSYIVREKDPYNCSQLATLFPSLA